MELALCDAPQRFVRPENQSRNRSRTCVQLASRCNSVCGAYYCLIAQFGNRAVRSAVMTQSLQEEEAEEELELSQQDSSKRKVGKWERRQRRIAAASKAAQQPAKQEAPAEEEFLQLVEQDGRDGPTESQAEVLPPSKKRIKLRKDGSAVHVPVQAELGAFPRL